MQIRDVAEMVREAVPGSELTFAADAGPDLRNYRADFSKLNDTFPELRLQWSVRDGISELLAAYTKYGLTYDDFTSSRFVRLRRLRELLDRGLLDDLLRRQGNCGPCRRAPEWWRPSIPFPLLPPRAEPWRSRRAQTITGGQPGMPGGMRLVRVVAHRLAGGSPTRRCPACPTPRSTSTSPGSSAPLVRRVQRRLRDLLVRA